MAKMQALRVPTPALVSALERGAAAVTEAIVDDSGNEFDLVDEAEMLESTLRHSLAGSVGAGICHLYMVSLGYVWHDFAANVITTTGKLADFVYDGGPATGHGVVLAEAKGSFASSVTKSRMQGDADKAYLNQVNPHIGTTKTTSSSDLVHGYAIAFGAQPHSVRKTIARPNVFLHVAETKVSAPVSAGGGGAGGDPVAVDTRLGVGNYRAAFMLAGAPIVTATIDGIREDRARDVGDDIQDFLQVKAGSHEFLVGGPIHAGDWGRRRFLSFTQGPFAVELQTARHFLNFLSATIREERWPKKLELRALPPQLGSKDPFDPILFPDGFASLGRLGPITPLRWSPRKGFL
jgi:hypothetical protein